MKTVLTSYSLIVRNVESSKRFVQLEELLNKMEILNYALNDGIYDEKNKEAVFTSWEPARWYFHENDMEEVSKKFPEEIFELTCIDESNTTWKIYFQRGTKEFCAGSFIYERPERIHWDEALAF